jgi:phosphoribosyl 1,2-cyclic phosphodiesterase
MAFATAANAKRLVPFHHDPSHGDDALDRIFAEAVATTPRFELLRGEEGTSFEVGVQPTAAHSEAKGS